MEKKNIYAILIFGVLVLFTFAFGYYYGIKNGVYETEKNYEKIVSFSGNISSGNMIEEKKEENHKKIDLLKENDVKKNGTKEKEEKNTGIINTGNIVEEKKEVKKSEFDLETDNSLVKFVTSTKSFNDKKYVPENMEKVSSKFVLDLKGGSQTLRKEANDALQEMAEKFFEEKNEKIKVVSAYRSYEYQVGIKSRGCPDSLCAKAGFSEHQTGLVVDLWSASSEETWKNDKNLQKYFSWLNENAHNFGFHNTYQKGLEIDGYVVEPWHWRYVVEPWHWRYVGVELATYLKNNNLTIAEYYKSL